MIAFCHSNVKIKAFSPPQETPAHPDHYSPLQPYQSRSASCLHLLLKKIAMSPGPRKVQDQGIILYIVDQKPIRKNVKFSMSLPIPTKLVIIIIIYQPLLLITFCNKLDHIINQIYIITPFYCKLVILLESG